MNRQIEDSEEAGFTLLELLVAVTLVVVMAVGVWTALDLCVRAWTRGIETIDINQRERSTQDLVRKQIASAYPLVPPVSSLSGTQSAVSQILAASTPIFRGGETSMRFISPTSLMSMDSAGLIMVTYEVEVDSDNNIHLVQREAPYIGQSVDDGWFTSAVYVFFNLKEVTFEYYNPGENDESAEWLVEWDTASQRRLPAAVRVSMLYKDNDKSRPGRQMVVPLHAQYSIQGQPRQQLIQRREQRSQPNAKN